MKTKLYSLLLSVVVVAIVACDPIEDKSLREKYFENGAEPITVAELNAALSVTQPIPNEPDKIEGDQYVVMKNSRPDIGGAWHYQTSTGVKTSNSDNPTVIYGANGEYDIYFEGISANTVVKSQTFHVTVTNCFDEYDHLLSGAENKADLTASKTYTFNRIQTQSVLYEGAHGAWKAFDVEPGIGKWWAPTLTPAEREQFMTFEFDAHRFTTYASNGTLTSEGSWAYTHETPEEKVYGEFITTKPVIGGNQDGYNVPGGTNKYWILKIDENELVIFKPQLYIGAEDWDNDGYYFFFEVK
jgi:hypothetical protein